MDKNSPDLTTVVTGNYFVTQLSHENTFVCPLFLQWAKFMWPTEVQTIFHK